MHRGGREQPVDASVVAPLHHRAKWRQEEALQHAALPCAWSILRQPTYLENFANDATAAKGTLLRQIRPGVVSGLLKPDEQFTVIAVDDLGALAVGMLRRGPEEFASRVRRSGDSNRQNNQQRPSGVPWPLLLSRLAPGQTLAAGTERISGRSLAAAASRVHGGASFAYKQARTAPLPAPPTSLADGRTRQLSAPLLVRGPVAAPRPSTDRGPGGGRCRGLCSSTSSRWTIRSSCSAGSRSG
jgi:hypothetical protein